jgi:glycosidase
MFPSRVASYNAEHLIGATAHGPRSAFATDAVLYRRIAELAQLRAATPALREGRQITRQAGDQPGVLAFSRLLDKTEVLAVFNTGDRAAKANIPVEPGSVAWRALHGDCAVSSTAPGSYSVELKPLDFMICVSEGRK